MPQCCARAVQILTAPLCIQIPADVSRKQRKMVKPLCPYIHMEDPEEALGFVLDLPLAHGIICGMNQ